MGQKWWVGALGAGIVLAAGLSVAAQSAPSRLGLGETDARENFLDSVESGSPSIGTAGRAFVALPPAARVAVVDAGFAWMKAYVASGAFKTDYLKSRESRKPTPPEFDGTVDDELKRKQDEQAKSIADSRAALALLPADQRAQLEPMLKSAEAQMKDPAMVAMMRSGIQMERARAQQQYQDDLKQWQEDMPADPLVLVAQRLHKFLDVSADVDFSAKLVGSGTEATFANADYQQKPGDWKMCYRAGKEAVTAARADAANWLKELPQR
jgi:hypothetical protein